MTDREQLIALRRRQAERDALIRRAADSLGLRLGHLTPEELAAVLARAAELRREEER